MKRLRIGYITTKDPKDRVIWSGSIHFMYKALGEYAGDIEHVGAPLPLYIRLMWHWINFFRYLFGQRLGIMQSIPLSLVLGRYYRKKIREGNYDVLFSPISTLELGYLDTPVPICYLSDTTFAALENYYFKPHQMSALGRWQAHHLQLRTIQKASALLYTSDWAARSAIRDYGADPRKIHILPFGANLVTVPDRELIPDGNADGVCHLLFVSADWNRKGGPIAYDTMRILREMGIDADLTVVGCTPSPSLEHPHLHIVPFLNKNIPADQQRFAQHYLDADLFLLPTRAECSGIVFCEASAYGLPSITTDTGGVSTPVKEGVNGFLHPLEATGEAYAATIAGIWSDPIRYRQLKRSSRERFESALNWKVWAESVREVMLEVIEEKKHASMETTV